MHLMRTAVPATLHQSPPPPEPLPDGGGVLDAIRARGSIRVGFFPDSLPFAFFNARGDLVGFDIELAHALAGELGVRLELIHLQRDRLDGELARGSCDLVMSGVAVTTLRASRVTLSNAYLDETLALVVPDEAREDFSTWEAIRARGPFRIAVVNLPYYTDKVRALMPQATIVPLTDFDDTFKAGTSRADAIALPAERGSAWTLLYPAYSVVVPEPGVIKIPLAYPIARHDEAFAAFLNTWIDLKRKDGTFDAAYQYWILGKSATDKTPRWSVIRNVLHWVE